jgi:hypothetical protein
MTKAIWDGDVLGEFDRPERARAAVQLAELMSDISERSFAAGWLNGTEYVLWDALLKGPRDWGRDRITADDIARLSQLSTAAGGWITYSINRPAKFIEMGEWKLMAESPPQP